MRILGKEQALKAQAFKINQNSPFNQDNEKTQAIKDEYTSIQQEIGWLIVHDERTTTQTFKLKIGRNIIGRKSVSKPCDVMIDTQDKEMSRNHCIIDVIPDARGNRYLLSDMGSGNGTFINAKKESMLKQGMEVLLQDGDIIQMGQTKVVIKMPLQNRNMQDAQTEVLGRGYAPTLVL